MHVGFNLKHIIRNEHQKAIRNRVNRITDTEKYCKDIFLLSNNRGLKSDKAQNKKKIELVM